mgnify:CR=1 FL=1
MSVSRPTQRNDFLRLMFSNNCCLFILFFSYGLLITALQFALFQSFCIFRHNQVVDAVLDVSVHEGGEIVDGVVDAVVRDASLRIVVGAYLAERSPVLTIVLRLERCRRCTSGVPYS